MNLERDQLVAGLATKLPKKIAASLVDEFIQLRVDVAVRTFTAERSCRRASMTSSCHSSIGRARSHRR
ncbi:MAG: hypothetical protein ACRDHS_14725 [Actinomycetota bacterium]